MLCDFKTDKFHIEYIESKIDHLILWESHCHTQYEMILVEAGDITVMLEGHTYHLTQNQILVIPPLFYHSVTANEKGIYRRITALFDIEAIPKPLHSEFVRKVRYTAIASSQIERIKEVCQKDEPLFYAPLLQGLMTQLLYDALEPSKLPEKIETDDFLQTALQYIDEHLQEKILLDDLAKHTARSKSSFCHIFEEKMNISPKQYILEKRLALASKLIDEGVPRTVAAMQVGYKNYSNFYRLYQKKS